MPADIQVNSFQSLRGTKMASDNTVFYEKIAEAVRNYPWPASMANPQMISRIQIKKKALLERRVRSGWC